MKGFDFTINPQPVQMRAALPVVRGDKLLWTGELMIGRTRIHIVGSTPLADAEQTWHRITSYTAKHRKIPMRLGDVLDEETGDILPEAEETEGVFDDIANFMASSPIAKTIEAAASFVPGLNVASSAAFGAAKLYHAARSDARKAGKIPILGPGQRARAPLPTSKSLRSLVDHARTLQQQAAAKLQQKGQRARQFTDEELMRAAQSIELIERARAGNPAALKVIGRVRTRVVAPGSTHHLDALALDAAQLVGPPEGDDAADAVEGLTAAGSKCARAEPERSGEIISADRLREAFAGGKSCGC